MRHGQSKANLEHKIVSDPKIGVTDYGLTSQGRNQVMSSAMQFKQENRQVAQFIRILSSDFLRARQTAELLCDVLECQNPITSSEALRERYFGDYEGLDDSNYEKVWGDDQKHPEFKKNGVESVVGVRARVSNMLENLEAKWSSERIILVAHGDVLQIAQTLFEGLPAENHRQIVTLKVAEIRRLS